MNPRVKLSLKTNSKEKAAYKLIYPLMLLFLAQVRFGTGTVSLAFEFLIYISRIILFCGKMEEEKRVSILTRQKQRSLYS